MTFVLTGAADVDVEGGERVLVTEAGAAPCRRCLRDVEPGDEAVLVSHDPFRVDSPYRGASPVFVHATPCEVYVGSALDFRSFATEIAFADPAVRLPTNILGREGFLDRISFGLRHGIVPPRVYIGFQR